MYYCIHCFLHLYSELSPYLYFFFITDKNGVKLAYCWLMVFVGMFFFSLINANTITKMFSDWSKIIKERQKQEL